MSCGEIGLALFFQWIHCMRALTMTSFRVNQKNVINNHLASGAHQGTFALRLDVAGVLTPFNETVAILISRSSHWRLPGVLIQGNSKFLCGGSTSCPPFSRRTLATLQESRTDNVNRFQLEREMREGFLSNRCPFSAEPRRRQMMTWNAACLVAAIPPFLTKKNNKQSPLIPFRQLLYH
ncbi:hypothetical protein BC827DRAFT_555757 [Russula dissimulans]|nr:hypothetical protein BC827DRAFT_555757 [Russula dissimulans]